MRFYFHCQVIGKHVLTKTQNYMYDAVQMVLWLSSVLYQMRALIQISPWPFFFSFFTASCAGIGCLHAHSGFLNRIQIEQSHNNIIEVSKTTLVLLPVIISQIHHVDQSVATAVQMYRQKASK